ncbi:hypothetical protein SESBI_34080 [Sesbania bispinosa]|nr:hypothetical protein SESBI_34080 [Sesbania bispinosa]
MAHKSSAESDGQIPSHPLDSNNPHPSKDFSLEAEQEGQGPFFLSTSNHDGRGKDATQNPSASKTLLCNKEKIALQEALAEDNGRERLKRHRVEVAGRVWIPDIWGQEELLKDWIDCTAFDAPLVPSKITMARAALVEEGRRVNAADLRIENRC